jgi:hypothetical protein
VVPEASRADAPGLGLNEIASLASLVADIAALGKPRAQGTKSGGQDG